MCQISKVIKRGFSKKILCRRTLGIGGIFSAEEPARQSSILLLYYQLATSHYQMGQIYIIKPLSTVLSSAVNKSQQNHEKNSWECKESKPGPLGEKQLYYAPPPVVKPAYLGPPAIVENVSGMNECIAMQKCLILLCCRQLLCETF